MCNFDFETEYYSPQLSRFYYAVSNTSQILTVILFPVLIYLILRKSKTLNKYKYYMLIHTVTSFFFTSFIWLLKPIPIFQKYGITGCGPLVYFENRVLGFVVFVFLISCWVNVSVSFSMSIIYRAFAPFPGKLQKFCDNSLGYLIFIAFVVILFHVLVVTPIALCYTSESTTIKFVQEYFPEMAFFQSKTIYFQLPPIKLADYFCLNIIVLYSMYYVFGIIIYCIFTLKVIKYTKVSSSAELVRLQKMFFKTITIQGIVEVILVITPAYIMALTFYFQFRYVSQIAMTAIMVCSLQAWINYVSVIYNITPYRKTVKKWFLFLVFKGKISWKGIPKHSVVSIIPSVR